MYGIDSGNGYVYGEYEPVLEESDAKNAEEKNDDIQNDESLNDK